MEERKWINSSYLSKNVPKENRKSTMHKCGALGEKLTP